MIFKKEISEIKDISEWWIRNECIQYLELKKKHEIDIRRIIWIYVLLGEFSYFGMVYGVGEHLELT
jgi:hypothetical protein